MKPFSASRRARGVPAVLLILVAVVCTTSACGEGRDAALPNSSDKVTADDPLTATQATEVRDAGHALMVELVDGVATKGSSVDDERSRESWTDCTAQQKDLFGTTYNGLLYTASVLVNTTQAVTATDVHALTTGTQVRWDTGDATKGRRGIFSVSLTDLDPLRLVVRSPCYFLRSSGGDGGRTPDDALKVTGFLRQQWQR